MFTAARLVTQGPTPLPGTAIPADYLHPIPAPEDLFGCNVQQRAQTEAAGGEELTLTQQPRPPFFQTAGV